MKSKLIHYDLYDYSKVDYKNNRTKVKIICKKHGKFKIKLQMLIYFKNRDVQYVMHPKEN